MDAASTAVAGTLLGVVFTHWFQARATERTAALARTEQLRQERIEADRARRSERAEEALSLFIAVAAPGVR
ncbi:hypothetical protein [Streptomyces sp. NK15101]|uniref:hypothetical protein n=1 Tax=Streptomyces sp. NK15101 TaxID=2873261 RepID=UPI001CEC9B38|nr:hypothetical protein [Streptomyces sp. NK15101]